jgi:C4-dicarboxylate-specific signal transduction histidine kinase
MNPMCDLACETGLQYFGKMTATLSHELKNALAIINENAGLLEDYNLMAQQGTPIDPQKLDVVAKRMGEQVARADRLLKGLNRFAHSVDALEAEVDVQGVIEMMTFLSHRLACAKGVTVTVQELTEPLKVRTTPFFLKNLLWLCLESAMEQMEGKEDVSIAAQRVNREAHIIFSGCSAMDFEKGTVLTNPRVKALLALLGAEMALDDNQQKMTITLPA